jgi:hypothetical protein
MHETCKKQLQSTSNECCKVFVAKNRCNAERTGADAGGPAGRQPVEDAAAVQK